VRQHNEAVNRLDVIQPRAEIAVEYAEGEAIEVEQHDGSVLKLRKLSASYDPGDRIAAMNFIHEHQARGEVVTGLLYVDRKARDLHQHLDTAAAPFNTLTAKELCPGEAALDRINASLR
jgi:2-oxoglutarate ferredoxin oxidoreductase subunit beta